MRSKLILIFLLTCEVSWAQRIPVTGRVFSDDTAAEGVIVGNRNTKAETSSARDGSFTIPAAVGDVLVFASIQFMTKEITITAEMLKSGIISLQLEPMVVSLDEVTITHYNNITSEALGLTAKDQKRYSPAERKLATAGDFKPIHLLGLLGGSLKIDPILNAINGKTSMLKKEIQIEKNEKLMEKINYVYDEEKLINEFKIPAVYVKGFVYYIADDPEFAAALKAKNDGMARFLISGLSVKYLKIIADDK